MKTCTVGVVIPVYNRASVVLSTLESVARQTRLPQRVVVVDDGSTDGTPRSVEAWIRDTQAPLSVTLLRQSNRGASAARNLGFAQLDCELIAFLDSDDLWSDDFLERAAGALERCPDAVAASSDRRFTRHATGEIVRHDLSAIGQDATRWLFEHDGGIGSCSLFRAKQIGELGGYEEELLTGHDSDLFLRLSLLGAWLYLPGEPTDFQDGLAASRGEAGHLHEALSYAHREWAIVHEHFVTRHGGATALPHHVYAARLARRWNWAGREAARGGKFPEARECYQKSLGWRRVNRRAWLGLVNAWFQQWRATSESTAAEMSIASATPADRAA